MGHMKEGGHARIPVDSAAMKNAVRAVLVEQTSFGKAAHDFGVKKLTLYQQVREFKSKHPVITPEIVETYSYSSNYNANQIFSTIKEAALLKYIQRLAKLNYGLSKRKLRKFVFKYAVANHKKLPPKWMQEETAGTEWMRSFATRYKSELSLRKPQSTSLARATSFNRTNVAAFFENLKLTPSMDQFLCIEYTIWTSVALPPCQNLRKFMPRRGKDKWAAWRRQRGASW